MGFVELLLIAVGLSMDAFAVAIGKGLTMKRLDMKQTLLIAMFFGGFQALMPLIGWALGFQFAPIVEPLDHWIAFVLLAFIGGKMLWDAAHDDDDATDADATGSSIDVKELLLLAIATSIDALATGITFAFLQVSIVPSIALIGVVTFVLSFAGVAIGHQFGARWERPSSIVGGVILILIGFKILLEHLGIIAF